jgi:alkylated DNA repair dioxygenase AlkB
MAPARMHQAGLFDAPRNWPEGFDYRNDLLTPAEERALAAWFSDLPFREFEFGPYRGKRRVVSFGWKYDFTQHQLQKAEGMPAQLLPVRESAAEFAGLDPDELQHVLLTEYRAGAAIGWHKDKHIFGDVIGLFASVCLRVPLPPEARHRLGARRDRGGAALGLPVARTCTRPMATQHSAGRRLALFNHVQEFSPRSRSGRGLTDIYEHSSSPGRREAPRPGDPSLMEGMDCRVRARQ